MRSCLRRTASSAPLSASHTRIVLSSVAAAIRRPSGLYDTCAIQALCFPAERVLKLSSASHSAYKSASCEPLSASQTRIVASGHWPPVTIRRPSGL